ncbi:MAG: hypothetical protein A2189_05510, partial [Paenibacillus sp. RIFOXYA1_FULL_44_5]
MSAAIMIFITFIIILLQRFIYMKFGLTGVTYECYFGSPAAIEGEEVEFIEKIANRKLLPIPWLRKESMFPGSLKFVTTSELAVSAGELYQNHRSMFSLMSYTQIIRTHKVLCAKRGWYTVDSANLTCGDLVDAAVRRKEEKFTQQILVYPKPLSVDELSFASRSWQGNLTVRRWILADPFSLSGVKEYQYGDPLNLIHWKATARTGRLQVHNQDYTANPKLMICLNFEVSESMWKAVSDPQLIEYGIRYAVTIAQYALNQGLEVGFSCNGYVWRDPHKSPIWVAPAGGEGQLYTLNETMAKLEIAVSQPFDVFLQQDELQPNGQMDFVIITP